MKICHCVHLYVIIYWKKHIFDLSPYTAFLVIACSLLCLNHVFLYFIVVIGVSTKLGLSSQKLCTYYYLCLDVNTI